MFSQGLNRHLPDIPGEVLNRHKSRFKITAPISLNDQKKGVSCALRLDVRGVLFARSKTDNARFNTKQPF